MPTTTLERRIGAMEDLIQRYGGDGGDYVADISSDPPRYLIDGREVDAHTFHQGAPHGPYLVDIGEEAEHAAQ